MVEQPCLGLLQSYINHVHGEPNRGMRCMFIGPSTFNAILLDCLFFDLLLLALCFGRA
jgi:hypothetical protein